MASTVSRRVAVNVLAVVLFGIAMVVLAFLTFVTGVLFDDSYEVRAVIEDAGGVLARQEVTVRGRAVGTVADARLVDGGVELTMNIQGDFSVPDPAGVRVLRRSPVGEQAVELTPVEEDWTAAEPGQAITVASQQRPATVITLLERTVTLFDQIDPANLGTVIGELATAFDGRAEQIRQLNIDTIDFGETILAGRADIERLLASSEPLLRTLDDHADDLEALFVNGADLAEVFADNRPNLETLLRTAPRFFSQAEALIVNTRANIQCLSDDLITVNEMLLGPSTAVGAPTRFYETKLDEVQMAIDKHRFFFQLGIPLGIQPDPRTGLGWARVKFELDKETSGDRYPELIATPPTLPGAACVTDEWGTGVNAVRQSDARPATPTSPGILYAPLVEETGPGQVDPPTPPAGGSAPPLPATGGGLAFAAVGVILVAGLTRRR